MTGTSNSCVKHHYECSRQCTILVRANVVEKLEIQLGSLVVHRDTVPFKCDHQRSQSVNTCDGKPYCMQSIFQNPFPRPSSNKSLHDREFLVASSLESARIMKNVFVMIGEAEFMFDAVLATLGYG